MIKKFAKKTLVFMLVLSFLCSGLVKPDVVKADSNDRRKTFISLMQGESLTDLDDVNNIDMDSLRAIALVASNAYIPWSTELDKDSIKKDGVTYKAMSSILKDACGFEDETADFMTENTLKSTLDTAKPLYIKKSIFEQYWKFAVNQRANCVVRKCSNKANAVSLFTLGGQLRMSASMHEGSAYELSKSDELKEYAAEETSTWLSNTYARAVTGYKKALEGYIGGASMQNSKGTAMMPVSYATFISIMALSPDLTYLGSDGKTPYNEIVEPGKYKNIKNTYQDQNLMGEVPTDEETKNYISNALTSNAKSTSKETSITTNRNGRRGKKPDICNFYWMGSNKETIKNHRVWSNSATCVYAYSMICDSLDYANGIGSSACSISYKSFKELDKDESKFKSLAWGNLMYVDWVGDIILDNGENRFILVPACQNPFAFSSMKGERVSSVAAGERLNGLNAFMLYAQTQDHLLYANKDAETNAKTGKSYKKWFNTNYKLKYYRGSQSLYNLSKWRVTKGDSSYAFDSSKALKTKGNTVLDQFLKWDKDDDTKFGVMQVNMSAANDDSITFPNWKSLVQNSYVSTEKSAYGTFGNNINMFNTLLVYDEGAKISKDSDLTDFFKSCEIFSVANSLNASQISINFSSVTDEGKTNSFLQTTSAELLMQSLFLTYSFSYFNATDESKEFDEEKNLVNMKFEKDRFPTTTNKLKFDSFQNETTTDKIVSFVYYLLHPTEGGSYVANLIKTKATAFLLDQHEKIVGASNSNYTTGTTAYVGTSSYTTIPSLYDISWVSKMLSTYNDIVVYLIILMAVILLCYVLVGSITLQRGIIGLLMFMLLAFLPPVAINSATNVTNRASNLIFSDKFDYWALCQLENYISELTYQDTLQGTEYIASMLKTSEKSIIDDDGSTSFSATKLKWMSPKRYNSTQYLDEQMKSIDTSAVMLKSFVLNSVAQGLSKETYLDTDNALYLYRDYSDIYRYASTSYNLYTTFNYSNRINNSKDTMVATTWWIGNSEKAGSIYRWWDTHDDPQTAIPANNSYLYKFIQANDTGLSKGRTNGITQGMRETSGLTAMKRGFLYPTMDTNKATNYFNTKNLAAGLLLNFSDTVGDVHEELVDMHNIRDGVTNINLGALKTEDDVKNLFCDKNLVGLSNQRYEYFLQSYIGLDESNNDLSVLRDTKDAVGDKAQTEYTKVSDYYYQLYTESPFYYFNYAFRDQVNYHITDYSYDFDNANTAGNVYKMFTDNNQGFFYNLEKSAGDGYGELRDFMNMHDLFYYVIPAISEGTDLVKEWDNMYGYYTYDSCTLKFTSGGKIRYNGMEYDDIIQLMTNTNTEDGKPFYQTATKEEIYQIWHDYNTYAVSNCYSAWLDTMEDCQYAKSETIRVAGDKFTVENPLSPYSYFEMDSKGNILSGRLMVFSRSEMKYYGLQWKDLTQVEQKIIKVQDTVYKKAIDLMNYYTLKDEVIIQGFSMLELFSFNQEFSENPIVGTEHTLYPQGYELKTFTYDAYLRLVLSEASGDSIQSKDSTSIYTRIAGKTSVFFSFFLLINDLIAQYAIPGLRLFFLIVLFFTSVLMIISSAIKLELNLLTVTWNSLLKPLLLFCGISFGMSWLVSLFMSNGADGVYNTSSTISLGDPTITVMVMIILNGGVTYLYYKVCKDSFTTFVKYLKAVFNSVSNTVLGAAHKVFSTGFGTIGAVRSSLRHGVDRGFNIYDAYQQRKQSNAMEYANSAADRGRENSEKIMNNLNSSMDFMANEVGAMRDNSDNVSSMFKNGVQVEEKTENKYDEKTKNNSNIIEPINTKDEKRADPIGGNNTLNGDGNNNNVQVGSTGQNSKDKKKSRKQRKREKGYEVNTQGNGNTRQETKLVRNDTNSNESKKVKTLTFRTANTPKPNYKERRETHNNLYEERRKKEIEENVKKNPKKFRRNNNKNK